MDTKIARPESYPDSSARGESRVLSGVLRQKYYYYGGRPTRVPRIPSVVAKQTRFRNKVVSDLVILAKGSETNASGVFDRASEIIANIHSLNPHVLAVALHIISVLKLSKQEDLSKPDFRANFEKIFEGDWNNLFSQLSKIKTKGKEGRTISSEVQMKDVFRYVQMYVTFAETE